MCMIFITSNKGKYLEAKIILGNSLKQKNIFYPELQADSIEDVVNFGIEYLKTKENNFIIEDSALFIDALNGFPGVYSSFVYRKIGNDGILKLMENEKNRKARFECCIGFFSKKEGKKIFKGRCDGKIAKEKRGNKGFGYDPIFLPLGAKKTFGEMERNEKNIFSHRAKALNKFALYRKFIIT
ncbi:MAG: XTP/dITP diphosphatase [Candidatus Thermoplasmatota archaeon]